MLRARARATPVVEGSTIAMMRRRFLLSGLGLVLTVPGIAWAQAAATGAATPLAAPEIALRVQRVYDKWKTYRAGFKQHYTVKAYAKTVDGEGNVVFAKPGKMSWRYTNNGNRIVCDGKLVQVYEPANNQLFQQPLSASMYPAALSFLVGKGQLTRDFTFQLEDAARMGFAGGYVLRGTPRTANAAYQTLFLFVDAATFHVRAVLLLDAQGNHNRFEFLDPEVDHKVAPSEFTFSPPPGTRVIKP
jgi:outer membrane lipoprotein carrier protein